MASRKVTRVLLTGDVMLGRLVDQLFPTHCHGREEDRYHALYLVSRDPSSARELARVGPERYIWGDTLTAFHAADLRLINLETSVTSHSEPWPGKAFNFRMHPENVKALQEAKVDFCSLANNHILDFGHQGLRDTCHSLDKAGIAWAGCGESLREALSPAIIEGGGLRVACLAMADHYHYWGVEREGGTRPGIHYVDPERFTDGDVARIADQVKDAKNKGADVAVMSVHWGPNYSWQPSNGIRRLAHVLVDRCGIDVIHGTSSHHVQGIEVYKGVPILYSCGDFLDDYAVTEEFRNDLSFLFLLHFDGEARKFSHMELQPIWIKNLSVTTLLRDDDRMWLCDKMKHLCHSFGTKVEDGENGKLVIPIHV